MRILVTNDDGISAPGIASLVSVARKFGEVTVVAPDRERSACSHAMTLRDPLRLQPFDWNFHELMMMAGKPKPVAVETNLGPAAESEVIADLPKGLSEIRAFQANGLPVDCVNLGREEIGGEKVDLVMSGINQGPNLGFDVTYSGTVAGAIEGCINGIPSIAISLAIFVEGAPLHFETATRWLEEAFPMLLDLPRKPLAFYNINVPSIAYPQLRGHRFTSMGKRVYADRIEQRSDPWGRPYYWQGGTVVMDDAEPGTDVWAVKEGFVSITPITMDWTDSQLLDSLR